MKSGKSGWEVDKFVVGTEPEIELWLFLSKEYEATSYFIKELQLREGTQGNM